MNIKNLKINDLVFAVIEEKILGSYKNLILCDYDYDFNHKKVLYKPTKILDTKFEQEELFKVKNKWISKQNIFNTYEDAFNYIQLKNLY